VVVVVPSTIVRDLLLLLAQVVGHTHAHHRHRHRHTTGSRRLHHRHHVLLAGEHLLRVLEATLLRHAVHVLKVLHGVRHSPSRASAHTSTHWSRLTVASTAAQPHGQITVQNISAVPLVVADKIIIV
jgi:hypothetical protein